MMPDRTFNYYLVPHNPHKIYLLTVCLLGGVLSLLFPHAIADSLIRTLPTWAGYVWGSCLAGSSGTALYGSWRGGVHGANIERLGLSTLAALCAVWAVAVVVVYPHVGWGGFLFYAGFTFANVARIRVINRGLKQVREELSRDP